MDTTDRLQRRVNNLVRYSATRRRSNVLHEFSEVLSKIHLSPQERATIVSRHYALAAQVCINRGDLRIAARLLCRAYTIATRHTIPRIAVLVASMRMTIARIQRDSRGLRLWTQRCHQWKVVVTQNEEAQNLHRRMYRETVVGLVGPDTPRHDSYDICDDLRHMIIPYQHCSQGEYRQAMKALDKLEIHQSRSVYLADEVRWLRLRICLSEQRYADAAVLLTEMKASKLGSPRMHECQLLAQVILEMVTFLYSHEDDSPVFNRRITSIMNSFEVLRSERTGLYFTALTYELVRLLLEQKYALANSRLAAFRVRLQRCKSYLHHEELHVFLKVIGYILATCHRLKRPFPATLLQEFHSEHQDVPYIQQGLLPYSELAYRLLRRMGYR